MVIENGIVFIKGVGCIFLIVMTIYFIIDIISFS